jgi:hypothetical protein
MESPHTHSAGQNVTQRLPCRGHACLTACLAQHALLIRAGKSLTFLVGGKPAFDLPLPDVRTAQNNKVRCPLILGMLGECILNRHGSCTLAHPLPLPEAGS